MDWLRVVAIVSLVVVAVIAGGSAVRLAVIAAEASVAVTVGLTALFLVVAVLGGAHGRRWRQNPYW